MKSLFVVAILGMLAGCTPSPDSRGTPAPEVSATPAYTVRTYDATYGVVCYRYGSSSSNLSCVKVH